VDIRRKRGTNGGNRTGRLSGILVGPLRPPEQFKAILFVFEVDDESSSNPEIRNLA
jgi:hypothetical protein